MAKTKVKVPKEHGPNTKPLWWCYIVAIIAIIIYLAPIYILLNTSIRSITDIGSRLYLPEVWNIGNWGFALTSKEVWNGLKNSLVLAVITVALEIVVSALGAYGVARNGGKLAEGLRGFNMLIMMIPGTAMLVGTYGLMMNLHLTNSLVGLAVLSAAGGLPGTMFMFVNFVAAIPIALDEAASIDGAGVLRTFFEIIMPQLKAVTVTRIIMAATGSWNNYLMPMYLLSDSSKATIILVIKKAFNAGNGNGNTPRAAAITCVGLLPVIILYLAMQSFIIEGQLDSSVK